MHLKSIPIHYLISNTLILSYNLFSVVLWKSKKDMWLFVTTFHCIYPCTFRCIINERNKIPMIRNRNRKSKANHTSPYIFCPDRDNFVTICWEGNKSLNNVSDKICLKLGILAFQPKVSKWIWEFWPKKPKIPSEYFVGVSIQGN